MKAAEINLLTVAFWLMVQAVVVAVLAVIENTSGAVSVWMRITPTHTWEWMIIIGMGANVVWVLVAAVVGVATPLPNMDVKRTFRAWLFPPPPAARRAAYANRAKRERRVIP